MVATIDTNFYSHIHLAAPDFKKVRVADVAEDEGYVISSYQELVHAVAKLSQWHRRFTLFFRGQVDDYTKKNQKRDAYQSTLRPTFFRPKKGHPTLRGQYRKNRQDILDKCCDLLVAKYREQELDGASEIARYKELQWALLQHYEVCPTPLIDVTQSLRVAASVASESKNKRNKYGYVYVLGMPHPNGSITYTVDEELMLMRLQSICPPEASRPHFQEGYLVGSFPPSQTSYDYELKRRLVGKFKLELTSFWSKDYSAIPISALMPKDDQMLTLFKEISDEVGLGEETMQDLMGLR